MTGKVIIETNERTKDKTTEYNTYVEECKVKAKEWINNRDGI